MNVDLHHLYHTRSLTKARNVFNRGTGNVDKSSNNNSSNGLSKSPGNHSGGFLSSSSSSLNAELNRRDSYGRTVLHLASSSTSSTSLEWLEFLLSLNGCQINLVDFESGWTALHRALYCGNIAGARLLLARDDIIPDTKDREGLTAFDVYNSTVENTNPTNTLSSSNPGRLDLFTFGSNRNFILGFASDNDRSFPERVPLKREEGGRGLEGFEPVRIKEVSLGRLHSGIVTDERRNNVRFCGYGTGGRLGTTTHTQFTFSSLLNFPHQISTLVLSADHTVLVTSEGDVYTFGLNRFSQLGYTIDTPAPSTSSTSEEGIQSIPKRVVGVLKKEIILGVACSRTHTAAFTSDSLYTWGTNKGQLGYSTPNTSIQILPRKVTAVPNLSILAMTATENATACVLTTNDVLVLYKEGYLRIAFPLASFPSRVQAYRPPQISAKPSIVKISSCGNTFAALSSLGDVFTFILDSSSSNSTSTDSTSNSNNNNNKSLVPPKAQRVWSSRRSHLGIVDVGVASDGSLILCTVSGHVYVRTRKFESSSSSSGKSLLGTSTPPTSNSAGSSKDGKKNYKISRIPFLQRCIKVTANSTGGFGALRSDVPLRFITIEGYNLNENLLRVLPHWKRVGINKVRSNSRKRVKNTRKGEEEEDEGEEVEEVIENDIEVTLKLIKVLEEWNDEWETPLAGSDGFISIGGEGGKKIPIHKMILASRSPILALELSNLSEGSPLILESISDLSILLFLHYLYSDDFPPIWDSRIGSRMRELKPLFKLDVGVVKSELATLAKKFGLERLTRSLDFHVKTTPVGSLVKDIHSLLLNPATNEGSALLRPDIILELEDKSIGCHSLILRSRCQFFETFFEDSDWTSLRRDLEDDEEDEEEIGTGLIRFDLKHVKWEVMKVVLDHIYSDGGVEMFEKIDRNSSDEYIDFVTQVMAVSNELLLDKLKLVCSAVLRRFVTLHNVCSILVDAAFYEAHDLTRTCLFYIASSMETVLETRLLDDLPPPLITAVAEFVQERQGAKMPLTRSGILVDELMSKHFEWYSELDVGKPTGGARKWKPSTVTSTTGNKSSPGPSSSYPPPRINLSPGPSPQLRATTNSRGGTSPGVSPSLLPLREHEEPFEMDDFLLESNVSSSNAKGKGVAIGSSSSSRWNQLSTESTKTPFDLRSIMAKEPKRSPSIGSSSIQSTKVTPAPPSSVSWRPTGASWQSTKDTTVVKTSLADIQAQQLSISPPLPPAVSRSSATPIRPRTSLTPSGTSPLPSSSSSFSRPSNTSSVITPIRMVSNPSSSSSSNFNRHADIPWTNYIQPISPSSPPPQQSQDLYNPFSKTPPSASSSSIPLASFASIQNQQREEVKAFKETKSVKNFAKVMEMEEEEKRAKREEEEFKKWWDLEVLKNATIEAEAVASVALAASMREGGSGRNNGDGGGKGKGGGKRGGKGSTPTNTKKKVESNGSGVVASGSTPSQRSGGLGGASRGGGKSPARGRGGGGGGRGGKGIEPVASPSSPPLLTKITSTLSVGAKEFVFGK